MQFGSLTSVELSVLPSPPDDGCVAAAETILLMSTKSSREPTANKKWEEIQP